MYGLTRGATTLIGVAAAGVLLWLATQTDVDTSGGYWAFIGLTAAAGFAMAMSQLLGGWTKWGWPRISGKVLALGFLPALVAGGWLILAHQPGSNWFQRRTTDWSADLRIDGFVDDMAALIPAIAFGLGLLLGFVFDTTGPRVREGEAGAEADEGVTRREDVVAQEPVTAERVERDEAADEDFREPDREMVSALTGRDAGRVQIREGGTPVAPQAERDDDRRRRT